MGCTARDELLLSQRDIRERVQLSSALVEFLVSDHCWSRGSESYYP